MELDAIDAHAAEALMAGTKAAAAGGGGGDNTLVSKAPTKALLVGAGLLSNAGSAPLAGGGGIGGGASTSGGGASLIGAYRNDDDDDDDDDDDGGAALSATNLAALSLFARRNGGGIGGGTSESGSLGCGTPSSMASDPAAEAPDFAAAAARTVEAAAAVVADSSISGEQGDAATGAATLLAVSPTLPPHMARRYWCVDDYDVVEKMYTGYASKVYKAVCRASSEVVVLKCYTLPAVCELYQHQIYREVRLHASLGHEHVVALHAAFREDDHVVLVQEYAEGGDLFALLQAYGGRLSERVAVQMVLEPFLRVLQYLHGRGIVHRDIKPENILFARSADGHLTLKLADFGLAIDLRAEAAVTRAGTLDYMAPEVLRCPYKDQPEENKGLRHLHYGGGVDTWAAGVLAYELLVGCPPFYDESREGVEARIASAAPTFPASVSDGARDFIAAALAKDAAARPSMRALLEHEWVESLRARRSMRQLSGAFGGPEMITAAVAVAAAAGGEASSSGRISAASALGGAAVPRGGGGTTSRLMSAASAAHTRRSASSGGGLVYVDSPAGSPRTTGQAVAGARGGCGQFLHGAAPPAAKKKGGVAGSGGSSSKSSTSSSCKRLAAVAAANSVVAKQQQTQQQKQQQQRAGAARPMASAASSPTLVADARSVQLLRAVAAGKGGAAAAASAGAGADAKGGGRQHAWLRLWRRPKEAKTAAV